MSENERLGIWIIDPDGFYPPLYLAEGHPNPDEKRLEFFKPRWSYTSKDIQSCPLHITTISGKPPYTYDKSKMVAQAEWGSVVFVKCYDPDTENSYLFASDDALTVWAITDIFLPRTASEAAYGPDILAIPWSLQP